MSLEYIKNLIRDSDTLFFEYHSTYATCNIQAKSVNESLLPKRTIIHKVLFGYFVEIPAEYVYYLYLAQSSEIPFRFRKVVEKSLLYTIKKPSVIYETTVYRDVDPICQKFWSVYRRYREQKMAQSRILDTGPLPPHPLDVKL